MTDRPQFVAVRFYPKGRSYTYRNDGPPVAVGDRVKVPGRDGWDALSVESVTFDVPDLATTAILGLVGDAKPAEQAVDDLFSSVEDGDDSDLFSGAH